MKVVDFREQVGIYCLYDNNFKLLYVGQAGFGNATLFDRLRSHTGNDLAERWTKFSWFGLKPVSFGEENSSKLVAVPQDQIEIRQVLNILEGILIIGAEPPLNRQGPRFGKAQKFTQHWDEEHVYPPLVKMVKDIYDSLPKRGDDEP